MVFGTMCISTCFSGTYQKTGDVLPNTLGINNNLDSKRYKKIKLLDSIDGAYVYYELNGGGYFIQRQRDGAIVEYCKDAEGPYHEISEEFSYFYGGPMNYYYLDGNNYIDIFTNEIVEYKHSLNIIKRSNNNYKRSLENSLIRRASTFASSSDWSFTYIDNYQLIDNLSNFRIKNSTLDYNYDNRCCYLAGAMVLYYSKYVYNNNFISDSYIETYEGVRRFTFEFTQKLVNHGAALGFGKELVSAYDLEKVMKSYCESIGIFTNHYAMALSTPFNIDMCIRDNKPMVLMGNFKNPYTGEKSNHGVCCYGIGTMPLGFGQQQRYFIVNYGWSSTANNDYSHVLLLDNLFTNPVGGMYNINYYGVVYA